MAEAKTGKIINRDPRATGHDPRAHIHRLCSDANGGPDRGEQVQQTSAIGRRILIHGATGQWAAPFRAALLQGAGSRRRARQAFAWVMVTPLIGFGGGRRGRTLSLTDHGWRRRSSRPQSVHIMGVVLSRRLTRGGERAAQQTADLTREVAELKRQLGR